MKVPLPYLPNTDVDRSAMLREIGVSSAEELFKDIPERFRHDNFRLPSPLSEPELKGELRKVANLNANLDNYACFLGAGYYNHFIPSVVGHIIGRSEFYTPYTPYQAEVSQGTLQAIYEYQSLVCQLTGMGVSNAGMYDVSTAVAEASLMACRVTAKNKVAVLSTVNANYREVINTYGTGRNILIQKIEADSDILSSGYACLIVQQPNFFGYFEDMVKWAQRAHDIGALFIVIVDPISLGMFKSPREYAADVVLADGQALGNPISFGGPSLGIFACRKEYLRQIPGRIVSKTLDAAGQPGYVLTLQTREQHVRREHATSNICTNEALVALATAVYMATLGKTGLRQIAELCYHKAHYAANEIDRLKGFSVYFEKTFFKEFVVRCPIQPHHINKALFRKGIIGGLDISHIVEESILFCVTESNTRQQIDRLVEILETL
jgi:glycine dehydrogenase subunit 1